MLRVEGTEGDSVGESERARRESQARAVHIVERHRERRSMPSPRQGQELFLLVTKNELVKYNRVSSRC